MLGVVCGLRNEAKIADRIPSVLVACSVAQPDRALALARHIASQHVSRIISFGLAAGLSQDLVAGDLILGGSVMTAKNAWEADQDWNAQFIEHVSSALCVPVWGSRSIVQTEHHKEMVYRRSGCLAADMESQAVALAAQEAGIPFNVVRAISDPYDMELPPAALTPLKEDGSVDLSGVFKAIKKEPSQILDLMRLGLNTSAALKSLKKSTKTIKLLTI